MKLHATANDLLIKECERLISGSVNIYTCEFTFDESWDGYTVNAVFSTGYLTVKMAVVGGSCAIPVEVMRPNAKFHVGLVGVKGDIIRTTTYSDWLMVEQGANTNAVAGNAPTQPDNPGGGNDDEGGNDVVELRLQQKTAVPDSVEVAVEADAGYDALSKVSIPAAFNLQAINIRSGVTMFGITGTLEMEE